MSAMLLQSCVEAIEENLIEGRVSITKKENVFVIEVTSGYDKPKSHLLVRLHTLSDGITHLARWVVDTMPTERPPSPGVRKTRLLMNNSF